MPIKEIFNNIISLTSLNKLINKLIARLLISLTKENLFKGLL